MITLPWQLGGTIRDSIDAYRRKNDISEPDEVKALGVHRRRDTFLESELELVRDLIVDKNVLEYIDLFPNVTNLIIDGIAELESIEIKKLTQKYPNLEKLTIKGQDRLQYLDISTLQKLQSLELVSNKGLHRVVGLDKIPNLKQLTFYDNIVYSKEQELCGIVLQLSQNGTYCNLDVLYMPTLEQIGITNPDNFSWCESVGLGIYGEEIKYTTDELEEAVNKARQVIANYINEADTTKQKFAILYQWMCENIKYDHDSLGNNQYHMENGENVGQLGGTNGTVNGLVYGSCVCEGYSKSMQLLLKLCGIPSFDVGCIAEDPSKISPRINIDGKKRMHSGDHSIIKVNIDGLCYYSDVTWDADRFQSDRDRKYFLLSKEEMLVDHQLVGEDGVFSALKGVSKQEFQELIEFAQERIKSVNNELEEKAKMEKTPQAKLDDINKQIDQLRVQYEKGGKQIEELMAKNQHSPIPNYQEQLNSLIAQRDNINSHIHSLILPKENLERDIKRQQQFHHNSVIAKVEKLLSMRITATVGYKYDSESKTTHLIPKNQSELGIEQGQIIQQLKDLYYTGKLDPKSYGEMTLAVSNQYNEMKKNAPKPSTPITDEEKYQEKNPNAPKRPYIKPDVRKKVEERNFQQPQQETDEIHYYEEKPREQSFNFIDEETDVQQLTSKAIEMGIDISQIENIEDLFKKVQIAQQEKLIHEQTEIEDHGMQM